MNEPARPAIALGPPPDDDVEQYGLALVSHVCRQLHQQFELPTSAFVPPGPQFLYESSPELFCGRRGFGPLRVAWDTNLVIDYFSHGRALWDRLSLPERVPGNYGEELEALQLVMALWVVRDIRISLPPRLFSDAKRTLSPDRIAQRVTALDRFAAALQLVGDSDDEDRDASPSRPLVLPHAGLERALERVPERDRPLVADAARADVHVFLTRDEDVQKSAPALRAFGLAIHSPADLLEHLVAAGAMHCLLDPQDYLRWPMPDQARIAELVRALPPRDRPPSASA